MGLTSGVGRSGSREAQVGAHDAFFQIVFGSDFFRFLVDFGVVLGAKMEPQIDFFEVFFDVFFNCDFGIVFFSDFLCFFQIRTLIFVRTASVS